MSIISLQNKTIKSLKKKSWEFIKTVVVDKFLISLIIIVFIFGLYSVIYWRENYKFCSADTDSSIELNVLYNSITGDIKRFFFSSIQQEYFIFDHLNLTFIFFILPFLFHPARLMYYFMHGITLSIGALPLYKISEIRLNSKYLAFMVSILYLFNPMLISFLKGCVLSMRTYSTIPFLLFTWYFYERKNFRLFTVFILFSVFTKENIGPLAIMMGLYFLYKEKGRKWGFTSIIAGMLILTLYITVTTIAAIFPHYIRVTYYGVLKMHFGDNLNPFYLINRIFYIKNLGYLIDIFSLFVFTPLLGIEILIISLPKFFENLIYTYTNTVIGLDIWLKNNAILIPFLFISIIYGLVRIKKISEIKISLKFSRFIVLMILILLFTNFVMFFIKGNDMIDDKFYRKRGIDWKCESTLHNYNKRWESLMGIKNRIPKSDGLLVDVSLSLPFADRKNFYIFRGEDLTNFLNNKNINYVLINQDLINCLKGTKDPTWEINITSIIMNPEWKKIEEKDGFLLLERI